KVSVQDTVPVKVPCAAALLFWIIKLADGSRASVTGTFGWAFPVPEKVIALTVIGPTTVSVGQSTVQLNVTAWAAVGLRVRRMRTEIPKMTPARKRLMIAPWIHRWSGSCGI